MILILRVLSRILGALKTGNMQTIQCAAGECHKIVLDQLEKENANNLA